MSSIPIFWWLVLLALVAGLGLAVASARRVPQGFEYLVERRGRYMRTIGAGLHFIVPGVDRIGAMQDIREVQLAIKSLSLVTRDEVSVDVALSCFIQVVNAAKASYEVKGLRTALEELVTTQASSVLAACPLAQLVGDRERLLRELPERLDRATDAWGVKVTRLDIRDVRPPAALLEAILEQRRAEHVQRAALLVAETERTQALEAADRARMMQISGAETQLAAAQAAAQAAEQEARLAQEAELAQHARAQEKELAEQVLTQTRELARQALAQEEEIARRARERAQEIAQRTHEQELEIAERVGAQAQELATRALEQERQLTEQARDQELLVAQQAHDGAAVRARDQLAREQAEADRSQRELETRRALHVREQEVLLEQEQAALAWRQAVEVAEREREAAQLRHAAEEADAMHATRLAVLAADREREAHRIRDEADAERAERLQQAALADAELAREQALREPALREAQARGDHALALANIEQQRQLQRAHLEAAREKQELELLTAQRAAALAHETATLQAQARELVADADARAVQKLAAALNGATAHAVTYLAAREHADALRSLGQSNARVVVVPGGDVGAGLDMLARPGAEPTARG